MVAMLLNISQLLSGRLCIFLGELSVHVFCPFHTWMVYFLAIAF